MPSEWPLVPIGSVANVFDGPHATPKKTDAGPVFLGISSLNWGRLDLTATEHLSEEDFLKWTRRVSPKANDVVFSYETRLGQAAIIPAGLRCCLGRRMALVRTNNDRLLPRFFLYYFLSDEFQALLRSRTIHGSTVERLPLSDFPDFPVRLPPLSVQREIADSLSALDDKIALLRETNATLEAIAQALFKSWFVDFDPVRAKRDGRDPIGMPPEVADLFPSAFEDSALGEIPKGWRVGTYAEIADVVGGATPSTKEPAYWEDGRHCWATPKDLSGMDTPVLLDTERKITDAGLAKISSGLLPVGTVLMSSRAPIGYLAIAEVPVAVNQGFIAMKSKADISNLFLLNLLRVQMDEIKSHANGSTFMEISKAAFRPLKVVIPPIPAIQAFDDVARSLYERMVGNVRQIANLTDLRDTLLPRLISGKLRLPEALNPLEDTQV